MTWTVDPYPDRLFSRRALRLKIRRDGGKFERIVWVFRRRPARENWAEMVRRAA
jgi:hypothetical protein